MVDNSWVQAKEERWRQTLSLQEQLSSPTFEADLSPHQSLQSQPVPSPIPQQPSTPVMSPILQTPNLLYPAPFQPPDPDPPLIINSTPNPIPNLKNNTPYVVLTHDAERPENAPIEFTQLQPTENESQIDALFLSGGISNVINLVPKLKRRLGMLQDQATQTDVVSWPENAPEKQDQQSLQKGFQKMDTKSIDDLLKQLFAQSVLKVSDDKKSNGNSNNLKINNSNNNKQGLKSVQNMSNSDVKSNGSKGRQRTQKQKQDVKTIQQDKKIGLERKGGQQQGGDGNQNQNQSLNNSPPSIQNSSNNKQEKNEVLSQKNSISSKGEKSSMMGVSATGMSAVNDVMAVLCGDSFEAESTDAQKSNALWTC